MPPSIASQPRIDRQARAATLGKTGRWRRGGGNRAASPAGLDALLQTRSVRQGEMRGDAELVHHAARLR